LLEISLYMFPCCFSILHSTISCIVFYASQSKCVQYIYICIVGLDLGWLYFLVFFDKFCWLLIHPTDFIWIICVGDVWCCSSYLTLNWEYLYVMVYYVWQCYCRLFSWDQSKVLIIAWLVMNWTLMMWKITQVFKVTDFSISNVIFLVFLLCEVKCNCVNVTQWFGLRMDDCVIVN